MESLKNTMYGVDSVVQLYAEKEHKGLARIERFEISPTEARFYNIASDDLLQLRSGTFCKLFVDGELMMSDTLMERRSNSKFINNANGRVLIAGLGIGMIIQNIIEKDCVKEIVVIEKYQDVIDLVLPKIKHPKLKVICSDIFDYELEVKDKYDSIYFDIWADICSDNLKDMKTLHKMFKSSLNTNNSKSFIDSWLKDFLQKRHRKELREASRWA